MLTAKRAFIVVLSFLILAACAFSKQEEKAEGPCAQTAKLTGVSAFTSGNGGGNRPLPGSPYGYEIWSAGGKNNKLIWFGPEQGGRAAFRAETRHTLNFTKKTDPKKLTAFWPIRIIDRYLRVLAITMRSSKNLLIPNSSFLSGPLLFFQNVTFIGPTPCCI
jgi:hypothetical protein